MFTMNAGNFHVTYFPDEVILQGDTRKIHTEAYKILMRFKNSPTPYHIKKDTDHQIILSARQE